MRVQIKNTMRSLVRFFEGSGSRRAKPSREPVLLLEAPAQDAQIEEIAPPPRTKRADRAMLARAFDSAHPVRTRAELLGREHELAELLAATLDFGQHTIVHGARGSGKTSLVRIFGDHADQQGAVVIYMACEPEASFGDLIFPYLRALPAAALLPGRREAFARDLAALPAGIGPRAVVELVAEHVAGPVIFIFDEFDRITDPVVKSDIAAAMKLLSDALTTVTFTIVGIARDVSDIVAAHPSLRRHMRTIALGRIEPSSVDALIAAGAASAGLDFDAPARALIGRAACGSPFHVRMFAHHAALAAVARDASAVTEADARAGLRSALECWASMNVADAKTFVRLIESRDKLDALEAAARRAAVNDRLDVAGEAGDDGAALLGDLMSPETGDEAALVFRDSVAPQFLIAVIILGEGPAVSSRGAPAGRELQHVVNF